MSVADYLLKLGMATGDKMKFALYAVLRPRYEAEYGDSEYAGKLAAAVANFLFMGMHPFDPDWAEKNKFASDNESVIEHQAGTIREWADESLCVALTAALYNYCYALYIQSGGRVGILGSKYLGYIRAMQDPRYLMLEDGFFPDKLEVKIPLDFARAKGLLRPLPHTPNSKKMYEVVCAYAKAVGC
jgi:hypothetical protein